MVTIDIASLDTCIPNSTGLEAKAFFLDKQQVTDISHDYLVDCLRFVLENTFLEFERCTVHMCRLRGR